MQNLILKGLNGRFKNVATTQYITRIKDSTIKTTSVVCISRRVLKGKKYCFWDINNFLFAIKSKMAAKRGKNWNFSPLHMIFLYYSVDHKFAQNHYLLPLSRSVPPSSPEKHTLQSIDFIKYI